MHASCFFFYVKTKFILITDFDDADEYEDCDPFGDYDAGALAEMDRVEREAFATGKYIYSSYLKSVQTHLAGTSHPQQPPEVIHIHESSSANIDPQLLTLEANPASAHPTVPEQQDIDQRP